MTDKPRRITKYDVPMTPCKMESRTTFKDTPHGKVKEVVQIPAKAAKK